MAKKSRKSNWDRWVVGLFVLLALWPICNSLFSINEWRYSFALQKQKEGDLEKAAEVYRVILKSQPDHHNALYRMAEISFENEEFEAASQYMQNADSVSSVDQKLRMVDLKMRILMGQEKEKEAHKSVLDLAVKGGLPEGYYDLEYSDLFRVTKRSRSRGMLNLVAYISAVTQQNLLKAQKFILAANERLRFELEEPELVLAAVFEAASNYEKAFEHYERLFAQEQQLLSKEQSLLEIREAAIAQEDVGEFDFAPLTEFDLRQIRFLALDFYQRSQRGKWISHFEKLKKQFIVSEKEFDEVETYIEYESENYGLADLPMKNIESNDGSLPVEVPYVAWFMLETNSGRKQAISRSLRNSESIVAVDKVDQMSKDKAFIATSARAVFALTQREIRKERKQRLAFLATKLRLLAEKRKDSVAEEKYDQFLSQNKEVEIDFSSFEFELNERLDALIALQHQLDTEAMVLFQMGKKLEEKRLRASNYDRLTLSESQDKNRFLIAALKLMQESVEIQLATSSYYEKNPHNDPIIRLPADKLVARKTSQRNRAVEAYHLGLILESNGKKEEADAMFKRVVELGFEPNRMLF